jgi:imidazole glycerol-phosphate synthase subunit HisH
MTIAIVKYNAGNIQSVLFALKRLGIEPLYTDNPEDLAKADKVIFPGVGEASSAMKYLKAHNLDTVLKNLTQPTLGICLGLQLFCEHSEENDTPCLGVFPARVKKFDSTNSEKLKVPHIGWNKLEGLRSPLFTGLPEEAYVYFVHGYYAELHALTIATANYIHPFSAAMHHKNFHAVQFHPEKSSLIGAQILKNFIEKS